MQIHGIVQGVGFRPFVHRLVGEYGLTGTIRNTSSGVELELEGERATLEAFVRALPARAPVLAVIEKIETRYGGALRGYQDDVEEGWRRGMNLVRLIGANARYFTDSAGKVPIDVGMGATAAGICIDFFGRFQAEYTRTADGATHMSYITPRGGSCVSADPMSLLRGAPHRELAAHPADRGASRSAAYRSGATSIRQTIRSSTRPRRQTRLTQATIWRRRRSTPSRSPTPSPTVRDGRRATSAYSATS